MNDDPRPLNAGVIGYPIAQSKSPRLFRHWFEQFGIEGTYAPYLAAPENFETAIRGLIAAGLRGLNCTIPHKEAALALANEVSDAARAIGAANTLTFRVDGSIHADNTDGFGFLENLASGAPGWHPSDGPALLLGAGGAARAAAWALMVAGCPEVRIANRTDARSKALAAHLGEGAVAIPWNVRATAAEGAALIANSTSLGMVGQPPLEMDLDAAPATAVVTDMVYAPLETDLLHAARERGLRAVDGLGMLLHQARPGFQAWYGREALVTDALRSACLEGVG